MKEIFDKLKPSPIQGYILPGLTSLFSALGVTSQVDDLIAHINREFPNVS